jgi:hypothetical protein
MGYARMVDLACYMEAAGLDEHTYPALAWRCVAHPKR